MVKASIIHIWLSSLVFLATAAFAQVGGSGVSSAIPRISDEGGAKTAYYTLNCVGAGIACTNSGTNATITSSAAAGGSGTQIQRANGSGLLDGIGTFTSDDTDLTLNGGDFIHSGNNDCDFYTTASSLCYNGTDLVANPAISGSGVFYIGDGSTPAKLRALTVGLGDSAAASVRPITMDVTGSAMPSGLSGTINYTGATITMRAQLFEAQHVGANATMNKIAVGANVTATLAGDTTGSVQMFGVNGIAKSSVALTNTSGSGTYTFQNKFQVTSVGSNTTTQPIYAYSGHFLEPGTFAGAGGTLLRLAILSEGDVAIFSDKKRYMETSATVLGDSYDIFNSATTDWDFFIDNTKTMTLDNDLVETFVPFKIAGTTLGAATNTITTPATNDDPTEIVRQNRVATTDATVTTIETFATTSDSAHLLDCSINARRTGGSAGTAGDVASYKLYCSAKNVGGTVTEIAENELFTAESQAGWDVDCSVSGTNYLVRVTGATNNNVSWHSTCRTYVTGS